MSRSRWRQGLPWVLAGVVLAFRLVPGPRTIDDAFITFRYARNLLAGWGLVYNPGQHVLGTTTPLYALWMALLGVFSGGARAPFPWLAWGTNAVADAATAWLVMRLARRLRVPEVGYVFALVWAVAPWSVTFAIGGMETSVYVFLLTAMVYAYVVGRRGWAFFAGALAFLTRPDALLLVLLVLADDGWRGWQRARREAEDPLAAWRQWGLAWVPGGLLVSGWLVFARAYYGAWLPHSMVAKQLVYRQAADAALVRLLQHYATPFLLQTWFSPAFIAVGLVLWPTLFAVGARWLVRREARLWPWLAFPWVYFAAFALANPLIFRWYLTPPLPPYFFGILSGVWVIGKALRRPRVRAAFLSVALLVPVVAPLSTWQWHPDHGRSAPAPAMAWYRLELLYHRAARFLAPRLQPDPSAVTVAAGDVGVLGYDTGARILDLAGLNSPETLAYFPLPASDYVINYAVPARLIRDRKPDYIVILEVYGRRSLLPQPWFRREYVLLADFPTDIYGSRGLLIFGRRR